MPLSIANPNLDNRNYQDLVNEALARIPVYNPEWTNFNQSDPGVTLIELFAFLTENLLYRANRIPEVNRRKFLSLLGVPLQPAASATGLVTLTNERGPLQTITLDNGLEVRAGQVPFRTERGLDVLPIEAQVYYKRRLPDPTGQLTTYYTQLFTAYLGQLPATSPLLYETVLFSPNANTTIDLRQETVDGSLWIAFLVRASDMPRNGSSDQVNQLFDEVRRAIGGRTLSLGIVPFLTDASRHLTPDGRANPPAISLLQYQVPSIPQGGALPENPRERVPAYRSLDATFSKDVLVEPGVVELTLPADTDLTLWNNLSPLEAGTGDFPPALQDTNVEARVITWLRITSSAAVQAKLLWVGINATTVMQRASIFNELLPRGTGEPDQVVTLSKTPVVPQSVQLTVTSSTTNVPEEWQEVDDLLNAGPEVPVTDVRLPPGAPPAPNPLVKVFTVDAESGEIHFGDGTHGARPPFDAILRANYDYGVGAAGNVGAGSINSSPVLPAGFKVNNPIRTWGGTDAETVNEGEKQIARYLQHRDRLVSVADFETITKRTPGVDTGRVEVLPAYNPALAQNEPGDAPGAVTLMVIPTYDQDQPDAPRPDRLFLNAICDYLNERRLVTTEVFVRGPSYKPIWVSVGIQVVAGAISPAQVHEAVKREIRQFLSPLPSTPGGQLDSQTILLSTPGFAQAQRGWPLGKPVIALELMAVVSRVAGVWLVNNVFIAEDGQPQASQIPMNGLELPRLLGISVVVGDAVPIDQLRGQPTAGAGTTPTFVPIPVIPEECM